MKKTNFLSSLAAVLVAGCMFTSCEKDDLNATFDPGSAKITLNVKVIDALSGNNKTDKAIIEVENNKFNLEVNKTTELEGISKHTIKVIATLGESGKASAEVQINDTKAGGEATYNVELVIADGLKITQTNTGVEEKSTAYATFDGVKHDASHSHNGITGWYINNTDWIQVYQVTYPVKIEYTNFSKVTPGEIYNKLDDMQKDGINAAHKELEDTKANEENATEIQVSAWAYFNASVKVTKSEYKWTVQTIHSAEIAATWTGWGISCTELQWGAENGLEIAHPDHAGHYQYGHGHGTNNNAGGGIVLPE